MTERPTVESGAHDLDGSGDDHLDAAPRIATRRDLLALSLGALGVVYGDLGTSPLYTIKECFHPAHGVTPGLENVLGVLSLVFWALIIGGIVLLVVWLARNGKNLAPASKSESALDILKVRYAKGEITKEQFDAIRRDLEV